MHESSCGKTEIYRISFPDPTAHAKPILSLFLDRPVMFDQLVCLQ